MTSDQAPWQLSFCAAYVVPPCKGLDGAETGKRVQGSTVEIGRLPVTFFQPMFERSLDDCTITIAFRPENGKQKNHVRTLILSCLSEENSARAQAARHLARRLAEATDRRSPDGLLIILAGAAHTRRRVVVWKFPADQAIRAELIADQRISLDVLQDAFSLESRYFKAAVFDDTMAEKTAFWKGKVEDRQARSRERQVSDFWIEAFLEARLEIPDALGSRFVARALRACIEATTSPEERSALFSAAHTLRSRTGTKTTPGEIAANYLPKPMRPAFLAEAQRLGFPNAQTMFTLDGQTLAKQLRIRSMMLENGFELRGPLSEWDKYVHTKTEKDGLITLTVKGRVKREAIRSS